LDKTGREKSHFIQPSNTDIKIERGIILGCVILILLHLLASFFPHARLWGINQLHYFPLEFRIALSVVALFVILIPVLSGIIIKILEPIFILLANRFRKINRYLIYTVVGLISLIPFWLFRSAAPLLGDGYWRASEIKPGILLNITESVDFYFHVLAARVFGWDGFTTYGILSCLAGGVYVFLIFLICDLWGKNGREKLLIFSLLITIGAGQLFFGYIESYSFMYLLLGAYLFFGMRFLKQQGQFVWPCLFLILASGFHLGALFFLPSLIYLTFTPSTMDAKVKSPKLKIDQILALLLTVSIIGLGIYFLKITFSRAPVKSFLIYPFGDGESFYSFFSLSHLLDFINQQVLIFPVGIILLLVLWLYGRKSVDLKDKVASFLFWVISGSFLFAGLVDPKLGYARDWDLFAFTGIGVTFLLVFLFLNNIEKRKTVKPDRITLVLFITSLVFTLPWIWVNASPAKAVARFEDLLLLDHPQAAYGYETLACYFRDRGENEKTADYWKKAIAINPNPRYFGALGNAYLRMKRLDSAEEAFRQAIQLAPDRLSLELLHSALGRCLMEEGKYDEAASEMKEAINLEPRKAEYYYALGNIWGKTGKYREAAACFETVLNLDPNYMKAYRMLAISYLHLDRKQEAEKLLDIYLRSNPSDAPRIQDAIDSIQVELETQMQR
jgi:Flp pilus assembly protein TadD